MSGMTTWAVWYDEDPDWGIYSTDWDNLPPIGVAKVVVYWPHDPDNTYEVQFNGWDFYWIEEDHANGILKVGYWNNDDPADPMYQQGRERHFHSDCVTHWESDYMSISNWTIPSTRLKRGVWVSDERAAELGVGP